LVDGTPEAAINILAQFALDSINQNLFATDLWNCLERHGLRRRIWNNDPHILAAVDAANDRYLRPLYAQAIIGHSIPRQEAQDALHMLQDKGSHRIILVSGGAGSGKSAGAAQIIEGVQSLGWQKLCFRLDRMEPASTARQLGTQMDLPDSPSVVLAGIAAGRNSLLVIDQLDAVSTTSGRHPQFFERVDEIIRQSDSHRTMRILLVCRQFDLHLICPSLRRESGPLACICGRDYRECRSS
jgi:hypothetical protein